MWTTTSSKRRRATWSYAPRPGIGGYLARYAALVSSADQGGVLKIDGLK